MTGSIVTFDDAIPFMPIEKLVAQIEPQQDLHGYDAPWAGGAGVNIFDYNTFENKLITSNGVISDSSTRLLSGIFTVTANSAYIVTYPSSGFNFAGHIEYNESDVFQRRVLIDQTSGSTQITPTTNRIRLYFSKDPNSEPISKDDLATAMVTKGTTPPDKFYPYSNECPISGWTGLSGERDGKNLLPNKKYQRGTNYVYLGQDVDHNYFPIHLKAGTYTLACNNAVKASLNYKISGGTTVQIHSSRVNNYDKFTLEKDGDYQFWLYNGEGISPSDVTEFQLEVGETKTEYEAYVTPNPITVSWQTEAGTVYGGTVDVVIGELVATHGVDTYDGSSDESWTVISANNRAYISVSGIDTSVADSEIGDIISNQYKAGKYIDALVSRITMRYGIAQINVFDYARITASSDANTWKALLAQNPLQVVYPLAEPIHYTLTPQQILTLLGNNTVFVDCGAVSVTYQSTSGSTPVRTSFKSPLKSYSYSALKMFGNTFIEHGKG